MTAKDYQIYGEFGTYLYNAIMACVPQHPIMVAYLDRIVKNILKKSYEQGALDITGPGALGITFKEVTGITIDKSGYYAQNILILEHIILNRYTSKSKCTLVFKDTNIFYTKYIEYHDDQNKIHSINHKKHYGNLYNLRQIYGEKLNKNNNIVTPEEFSNEINKKDNKQLQVKFYRDISVNNQLPLKRFTTLNNIRQKIYYSFNDNFDQSIQKMNLYYLQMMNSELDFINDENNKSHYVDLSYFFLYPLRYYDSQIIDDSNIIYYFNNIKGKKIENQKYQIIKL
jgi:hypothetical protein